MNFIKSAPDLLAACKRVISDINEIGEVDDGTVKCVEEAIAEAVRE